MVCGNNPLYYLFLVVAGVPWPVSRFRDLYFHVENGKPFIVVFTRTGGPNREEWAKENEKLTSLPSYVGGHDCDFDPTFAHWYFRVPAEHEPTILRLAELLAKHPKFINPRKKFNIALGTEKNDLVGLDAAEAAEAGKLLSQLRIALGRPQPPKDTQGI